MDCYYAEYCEMHKYAGGGEVAEWLYKDHRLRGALTFIIIRFEIGTNRYLLRF